MKNKPRNLLSSFSLCLSFFLAGFLSAALAQEAKPRFEPIEIKGLQPRPEFWKVRPAEILDLCRKLTRGRSEIIATTPGGFPVYAVFYGDFSEGAPQTNWSAGSSSDTWRSYYQREGKEQTVLFCAGIHGALALTLECCVSADYPPQKPCDYTFEEMMEPNFIMLKVLLADGLKEPFADRAALFR